MTEQKFDISGMTCAACSAGIQKTVGKMNGVRVAEVSLMGESMRAEFDENAVSSEDIVRAVESLGYGARIESDLRDTKPDVVSILIGINDTWRRYDENDPTTALAYEQNMRGILKTVRAFGAKIILLEPFLLPTLERFQIFREDLDFKIDAARKLAREFADAYVPLDGLFAEETLTTEPALLSFDSVHPTELGNEKIARWWLERVRFEV